MFSELPFRGIHLFRQREYCYHWSGLLVWKFGFLRYEVSNNRVPGRHIVLTQNFIALVESWAQVRSRARPARITVTRATEVHLLVEFQALAAIVQ